ncbi:MAG: SIS domain-containing protein [Halanaerobiales bacterium]|nr:SIS domain-containing protein [Halanaerobiales bacterium]
MKEYGKDCYQDILNQDLAWGSFLEDEKEHEKVIKKIKRNNIKKVIFIGCGSSYYIAISGAFIFKKITGIESEAVPGSEMMFNPEVYLPSTLSNNEKTLLVPISRSGQSIEIIEAMNQFKENDNIIKLALTCNKKSKLVNITDHYIYSKRGLEKSLIMSRSFTSMLLGILLMASLWVKNTQLVKELKQLPTLFKNNIKDWDQLIEGHVTDFDYEKYEFLGQGSYFGIANEAMLKMKEMAITVSEDFHSLEFRHGPKSIVDSNTLITLFIGDKSYQREKKLSEELKSYGGDLFIIGNSLDDKIKELSPLYFEINSELKEEILSPLILVPAQLLAYHLASKKGLDVENPKNLSKVVENI